MTSLLGQTKCHFGCTLATWEKQMSLASRSLISLWSCASWLRLTLFKGWWNKVLMPKCRHRLTNFLYLLDSSFDCFTHQSHSSWNCSLQGIHGCWQTINILCTWLECRTWKNDQRREFSNRHFSIATWFLFTSMLKLFWIHICLETAFERNENMIWGNQTPPGVSLFHRG